MTTMTLNECINYLKSSDGYLLLTHIRPDGDTLGSAAALCHILRRLGKVAFLYPNPQITTNYDPYVAPYMAPPGYEPVTLVSVDLASENLFPEGFSGGPIGLCIDHHPTNSGYAQNLLCMPEKASCGEIVLELAKLALGGVDKTLADLLYMAVSTDCGCFVYANTKPDTHRAAAELMEAGADYKALNKKLFRTFSYSRLMLEGMIYTGMKRFGPDGCVTVATVTLDMMAESEATEDDCEDLASLAGRVAGNKVSVTIRQLEPKLCKVSLRSGEDFDSAAICALHGGGGHKMAAGCTVHSDPDETCDVIVWDILEAM